MAEQWYYSKDGQQLGPVTIESLQAMAQSSQLRPDDWVWMEGMADWVQARNVPMLFPGAATSPLNYQTPMMAGELQYAGFWLRFVAALLDGLIMGVTGCVVGGIVGLIIGIAMSGTPGGRAQAQDVASVMGNLVGIVMGWLYFSLMESSAMQATLGERALGLKVTTVQGERITFGRATGRHFAKIISGIILLIGYMMAGWTERKQALHDMMADTLVVRSR